MKYIITSGPMETYIDDVRTIKNSSTGKLGAVICQSLIERGISNITYIHTRGAIVPGLPINSIAIADHHQLLTALKAEMTSDCCVICAMAISDFTVSGNLPIDELTSAITKMPRDLDREQISNYLYQQFTSSNKLSSSSDQIIYLKRAPKIIDQIKAINPKALLVGFKLLAGVDQQTLISVARDIKNRANCDIVVANHLNDVKSDNHTGYIITNDQIIEATTKKEIANQIINELEKL